MPYPSKRFGMAASSADHYVVRLLGAAAVAEIFDNSSAESADEFAEKSASAVRRY